MDENKNLGYTYLILLSFLVAIYVIFEGAVF